MSEFGRIERMGYYHRDERVPDGGDHRVITGPDGTLDIIGRSMLTGGRKYSRTTNDKPGEEKLRLFADVLKEIDELTIIGYSFGDAHVNNRISNAMVINQRLKLLIVDPVSRPWHASIEQFDYASRLRKVSASAAVWMTWARSGESWDTEQMEALKRNPPQRAEIQRQVIAKLAPGANR